MRRPLGAGAFAAALLVPGPALATGFTDYGQDLEAHPEKIVAATGALRLRTALLYNLDLDRGATPSGQLLCPVPLADPGGQTLTRADMRLRADAAAYLPDGGLAVKVRVDALDNLALGSAPDGIPSASLSQRPVQNAVRIERAWGEALTPFGLLSAGRMGSHWGLGMLTNGGDCPDCDSGDAADRIAFITPLLGHIWAVAYDFSATGPFVPSRGSELAIDIAPSASVHTLSFAALAWRPEWARRRRARAGKVTPEYGAYGSHRWQKDDVPATYLPTAQSVPIDAQQVMARGYVATAADLWLRLSGPSFHVEAEAAFLHAKVDQPSLIPGVLLREPVTSTELGVALESRFGDPEGAFDAGLDAGYASGDDAPGFGAFPPVGAAAPRAGDLDGPQSNPPFDTTVNNFRFHPDYRIDRILFREIVGTVTDAVYLRPHARLTAFANARGALRVELAGVLSLAAFAESSPGGERLLGVEIDPTLAYEGRHGFVLCLEPAVLVPLRGLDNAAEHLRARVAQLWRLRLVYGF
ncbi:MAG: TIGR04551 family protein [Deltaproteobacteria bacterium]|nr:TIGR04551 family protein [Deltaproteobacteria bacterium]